MRRPAAGLALVLTLTVVGPGLVGCDSRRPDSTSSGSPARSPISTTSGTAVGPASTGSPAAADGSRPNILLIEADDMRADELRWMPRTSRLIGDMGLRFENSFSPNPLCCPARASLLTGEYSHNHGVISHVEPWGFGAFDDSDTLATRLMSSGYRTALVGKYLNGYGVQPTHATGAESLTYVPPGWTQWWGSSDHKWQPGDPFEGGTYNYFNLVSDVNGQTRGWPGRYTTGVTAGQTQRLIRGFASDRDDAPWFVWWNPIAPHDGAPLEPDDPGIVRRSDGFPVSWDTPARPDAVKGRFDDRIPRGAGVPADGRPEPDRSDKPAYLRNLPELTSDERDALRTVTRQRAEALSVLDGAIARTLGALRRTGEAGRTLVVFTSDNGYYLGEHLKRQGKINLHEPSIRVPLLMSGPGVPRGVRYDPVTTVDLSATFAARAGVDLRAADGVDLSTTIDEGDRGWTRPVVIEGRMPEGRYVAAAQQPRWGRDLDTIGLRLGRWKIVRYSTGELEVYDLLRDPLELDSLQRDPGSRGIRRLLLREWDRLVACRTDGCRTELPTSLRLSAAQERSLTVAMQSASMRYYRGRG